MKWQSLALAATATALLTLSFPAAPAAARSTIRVSHGGGEGGSDSSRPSVSAEGRYVAFASGASNLVPGDTNAQADIFVRDTVAGTTGLVSVDSSGAQANGGCFSPSISADGRYVAFDSYATNLAQGDTNNANDIFVRDTLNNTTTRISMDSNGSQGNSDSGGASLSADGRYVAFESYSTNLVPEDTNESADIFVRDTLNNTTTRVSVDLNGVEGDDASFGPSISANGRYVAFYSNASNLVPGDTNDTRDIFVRDTLNNTTTRVSIDSIGTQGDFGSRNPSISADGRYVAFESLATNLVPGDTNDTWDVFVRDTLKGTTTCVSVDSSGILGDRISGNPSISADGRYVAFGSTSSNLVPGDTKEFQDVFVRDTMVKTTTRVSVDSNGAEVNGDSDVPSISADGRYVAFTSYAPNLVSDDTDDFQDIFLRGPLTSIAAGAAVKSSPTAVGGIVYFGDDSGKLHAVNTTTGVPVPGFPVDISSALAMPVKLQGRPAVYFTTPDGQGIYFTTDNGDLMRANPDGSGLGAFRVPSEGSDNTNTPAVLLDGTVYFGLNFMDTSLVAKLNPDLSLAAASPILGAPGSAISSVAVAGNKVYVGFTNGSAGDISVLNAADLVPLSSGLATGEGATAPPYVVGADMYVGTLAGNFYKLNSSNNNLDTLFGTNGAVAVGEPLPTSAFLRDGAFYAGSSKGKVWKIGVDGSLSTAYDTGNASAVVGGVVVASSTLAFGTSAGNFYRVPLNGGDAAIFGPHGAYETTPTYDASTRLFFIGSDDGNVYGF
jgi:Tol biopolymer transport system component